MDLFREIEKNLRSYTEHLPIDDFLPPPEEIPSALSSEPAVTGRPRKEPKKPPKASSRPTPIDRKPDSPSPGPAHNPISTNLDAEIRDFLHQQRARGMHDPSEWVQESPTPAGKKEPDDTGGGSPSDS